VSGDSFCAKRMPTTKGGANSRDFAVIPAKLVPIASVRTFARQADVEPCDPRRIASDNIPYRK
jgi:hypothetical protein